MAIVGVNVAFDGSQLQSSATQNIDFVEDRLYIIFVANRGSIGGTAVDTLGGGGISWAFAGTSDSGGTASTVMEAWWGIAPGDLTDKLDIVLTQDPARVAWSVEEFTGATTDPIIQVVGSEPGNVFGDTLELAPFENPANNVTLAGFNHRAFETSTLEGGYTQLANSVYPDVPVGGNPLSVVTGYIVGEDPTPSATWPTQSPTASLALEISAPPEVTLGAKLSMPLTVYTPTLGGAAVLEVSFNGTFQENAFQDDTFQVGGSFLSMLLHVYAPTIGPSVLLPGFIVPGFQPDAFQLNTFQAGNSGLFLGLTVYAPLVTSTGAPAQTIYLGEGATWNDLSTVWNDPDILWNQGGGDGLLTMTLTIYEPTVTPYTFPQQQVDLGFLSMLLGVNTPVVFSPQDPVIEGGAGLKGRYSPRISSRGRYSPTITSKARHDP